MTFLILLLILSTFAGAQDCSEVNLITQPHSPFEQIPVYDQNGSGMCYAYATSELLNYQLIKNGTARSPVVHPAWVGVNYADVYNESQLRGGTVLGSVRALQQRNICPYESVTQAIGALARRVGVPESRILKFIDDYGKLLQEALRTGEMSPEKVRRALVSAARKNERGCSYSAWTGIFSELETLTGNSIAITERLLAGSCQPNQLSPLNLPLPQTVNKGDDPSLERKLFETLGRNQPVAMTFCSWATDRAERMGLRNVTQDPSGFRIYKDDSPAVCGAHVALVAGKKMIHNKCNFLYLNSHGSGWNSDNRHLTCLCRNKGTGQFVDECTYQNNRGPQYSVEACWVPSDVLVPNISEIEFY